jgi:hypothetical protein
MQGQAPAEAQAMQPSQAMQAQAMLLFGMCLHKQFYYYRTLKLNSSGTAKCWSIP